MEINKMKEMSHILSGSESMTSLNDEADSSLFEEANSSQRNGEGRKKGPWTSDEDAMLVEYVRTHGEGNWNLVQKQSGLSRCGKSCRLRWANHLRPDLKKGPFSSQEERLIVELHSKFGNKWARMAAHLPGRTDNEIKNYWNTRVKRCERAGLPLYPPDLNQSMQLQANNHFNNSEPHNRGAQGNNYDITDVIFDHFKGNRGIQPFLPTLHGISSVSSMLNQGSCPFPKYSPLPSTPPQAKRIRSETFLPNFNFGANEVSQFGYFKSGTFGKFTHASDPKIRNHVPYGVMPVTPSLLGGDFSSSTSSPGSSNLELPSLQFTPGIGNWKTDSVQPAPLDNIQSPPSPSQYPSEPVQSDYSLLRNNGLLDAVLYEPQIQNNTRNQPSETPVDVVDGSLVAIGEDGWEEFIHPLSPLRSSSVTPVYNGRPLVNGEGSSQEQQAQNLLTGSYVELEPLEQVAISDGMKEISSEKNKNNALLDMEWYELVECCKDQSNIMDGVSISYGEDIQSEYREMVARTRTGTGTGTGTSTFTQG